MTAEMIAQRPDERPDKPRCTHCGWSLAKGGESFCPACRTPLRPTFLFRLECWCGEHLPAARSLTEMNEARKAHELGHDRKALSAGWAGRS